jgi:hypothetical protein
VGVQVPVTASASLDNALNDSVDTVQLSHDDEMTLGLGTTVHISVNVVMSADHLPYCTGIVSSTWSIHTSRRTRECDCHAINTIILREQTVSV